MNIQRSHRDLISVAMLCGTLVLCVWLYTYTTRYAMIRSGDKAYRYDRRTGEVWLVNGSSFGPVEGPVNWAR